MSMLVIDVGECTDWHVFGTRTALNLACNQLPNALKLMVVVVD